MNSFPTQPNDGDMKVTPPVVNFARSSTGLYVPINLSAPKFISATNSPVNNPFSSNHFFISVTLAIAGRKIRTYAFLDSGATGSHVSESFVKKHSLPRHTLPTPIPIKTVDGRPLASGFMSQELVTGLHVKDHYELAKLGIVSSQYPIILGLDWLTRHNPNIDWKSGTMKLHCCNIKYHSVVKSFGASYNLDTNPIPPNSGVSAIGIGPRLAGSLGANFSIWAPLLTKARVVPSGDPRLATKSSPHVSIAPEMDLDDDINISTSDNHIPDAPKPGPSQTPVADLAFCSFSRFKKYAKHSFVACINVTGPAANLCATAPDPEPPDPSNLKPHFDSNDSGPAAVDIEDTHSEFLKYVPWKYAEFEDVFSFKSDINFLPPHRDGIDLKIETPEGKMPPWGPLYSMSESERQAVADYIEDKLACGHIRPSKSPAGAPVLFTQRKTGKLRFCVDYRGLNAITKRNSYPLPLPDDLLDRTRGCTIFTAIDLKNAFNLIRIAEGDEWKTAFRTHLGLYEMTVMPYGLTNAPANFQFFINRVLADLIDIKCTVYLDDILVFSKTQDEHDQTVREILTRLRADGLYANPAKCEFDKSAVEYLGYIVSADGISMNPKKLSTINDWPVPASIKQVQSFVGFANFYRRFIHQYAKIVKPLQDLTHKTEIKSFPDPLPPEALQSFNTLKELFVTAPLLRHFDPRLPVHLISDASDFAMSGILLQPDNDGLLHPCSFYSRKWSPAEVNYDTHDKELLAIIETFRDMRSWCIGTAIPVSVYSDHKNLEYWMTSRPLNGRQSRWVMFLEDFNFKLSWLPGSENPADFPSRRSDFSEKEDNLQHPPQPILLPHHIERLYSAYSKPSEISAVLAPTYSVSVDNSELLSKFKAAYQHDNSWREQLELQKHPLQPKDFRVDGDLVFYQDRLYVPPNLRSEIVYSRHDSVLGGHPGRARTFDLMHRDYSWPGMRRFIRAYCSSCDVCQRNRNERHSPYGLLQPLAIPERPWKAIAMDFIVKLPRSRGYDSIWVVVDRLTRAAHFIPIEESTDSSELVRIYLANVFKHHGFPESILSDRGPTFVSSFFSNLMKLVGSKMTPSTAYHPQTDGLTERSNQTLESYLRNYCSYQQDDWVDYLPLAEFAFNSSVNSSTQVSPFYANLGYHPSFDTMLSEPIANPASSELASRLDMIHSELRAELAHAQQSQAHYYNLHHKPAPEYSVGENVWLLRRNIKTTRPSNKLDYRKLGPFEVLERRGRSGYRLALPKSMSRLHPVFDVSLLEPWNDPASVPGRVNPPPPRVRIETQDTSPQIESILDCRKVGRRFDYLVKWLDHPSDENSWIHLSDIPKSKDELLEVYHRRNSSKPHPPRFDIERERSARHITLDSPPQDPPQDQNASAAAPQDQTPITAIPSRIPRQSVDSSSSSFSSTSRRYLPQSLREVYIPPSQTTLRSGRLSRPRPVEGG